MKILSLMTLAAVSSAPALAAPRVYTLTELFRATVETSDSVREKAEERAQAEENKAKAGSGFLPQVNGIATYQINDTAPSSGTAATIYPKDQKIAKLTGTQYLFQGGSEYAYYRKANRLIDEKSAELDDSRHQYYLALATAYYDYLLKQSNLQHAKEELSNFDDQIKELNSRVRIGRSRTSDLLTAKAGRASSESRVHSAENDLATSRLNLNNTTQVADFEIREENPVNRPLEPLEVYLKASEQRPDLIAARKLRDAAYEDIAYYRGFHLPDLNVTGNYYLHREGGNADSKWDALFTLTLPIFSGGATQANVRGASSVLRENEVKTGNLERTAETEVRQLHQALVLAEPELKALADAVDLATKAYEQTKKDYRLGLTTNLDLIETVRFLTEAKQSYDQAKYQHLIERIRLEIGAGRIPTSS
jgi:outer membrane protein